MFSREICDSGIYNTSIPNIFIDLLMISAPEPYIKVYLTGLRSSLIPRDAATLSNRDISDKLGISVEEVSDAWRYWESFQVVRIYGVNPSDKHDFSVDLLDLTRLYVNNIASKSDGLSSDSRDEVLNRDMFSYIESLKGNILSPSEGSEILEIKIRYGFSHELIKYAFELSKEDSREGLKSWSYTRRILENWHNDGVESVERARELALERAERNRLYVEVLDAIGQKKRYASEGEKKLIDSWVDEMGYGREIIGEALLRLASTNNPTVKYIGGILGSWHKEGLGSLEEIREYERAAEERRRKSSRSSKSKSGSSRSANASSGITRSVPGADRIKAANEGDSIDGGASNNSAGDTDNSVGGGLDDDVKVLDSGRKVPGEGKTGLEPGSTIHPKGLGASGSQVDRTESDSEDVDSCLADLMRMRNRTT